jgi:FkbM family methyltransferase
VDILFKILPVEARITLKVAAAILRRLPPRIAERFFYRFFCGRSRGHRSTGISEALTRDGSVRFNILRGDVIGDSIYLTGFYESLSTEKLLNIATKEGGFFVDVGANIGYYTILWAKADTRNRCVAIEASPRILELLKSNVDINRVAQVCEVLPIAVSNEVGVVSFDQGPRSQTGWGGISEGVGSGSRVIKVPCKPLDAIVPEGRVIRLMKIDVEGAEALIFEGMERLLLNRQVQEIWFEDNVARRSMLNISPERLTATLLKHGYQVTQSTKANPLPMDYVAIAPKNNFR